MNNLEVVYLFHSGFAVKTDCSLLIFDYYKDKAHSLPKLMESQQVVYFFSSHSHADHFNPEIAKWREKATAYFLSDDILAAGPLAGVESKKVVYLKPYENTKHKDIAVTTFGSTDTGVSFLVEADGWRIFHAGDLNWWHWKEDTQENIREAKALFEREMKHLDGLDIDLAFFPVDSRLQEYSHIGAEQFCRRVNVNQLVTMHSCGKVWQPPVGFPGNSRPVTVWCPAKEGQTLSLSK